MGNCLVTKLQESVTNEELLRLGYMRVKVTNAADMRGFRFVIYDKTQKSYLEGGKVFNDTGTSEHTGDVLLEHLPSTGSFTLQLPKYDVAVLNFYGKRTNPFVFNIEDLQYGPTSGDMTTAIYCYFSTGATGNLGKLVGHIGLNNSNSFSLNVYATSISGTIIDALNLFVPALYGAGKYLQINVGDSLVTGNVKDFLDLWASRAEATAQVKLYFENCNVDISQLTPTPGVSNPKVVDATCTGNGEYTYTFATS